MPTSNDRLQELVLKLYHAAISRAADSAAEHKRNTVMWRIQKDGWYSVRCLSVTEYSKDCFRFRNEGWRRLPKYIWPFSTSVIEDLHRMEVTVHYDEIDERMFELLLTLADDLGTTITSELFRPDMRSAHYAWTVRAWAQQEANRKSR